MAITKEKKKAIIEKLGDIIKASKTVVFVNFHGVNVGDSTKIRKTMREQGVGYFVAKKTLIKKILNDSKFKGNVPELPGELAVAYGEDLLAPARETYSFQKKLEDKISILGGIFEGKFIKKEDMLAIAQIPTIKTLQAQFVQLINSPIQGMVIALSEIAKKKS